MLKFINSKEVKMTYVIIIAVIWFIYGLAASIYASMKLDDMETTIKAHVWRALTWPCAPFALAQVASKARGEQL